MTRKKEELTAYRTKGRYLFYSFFIINIFITRRTLLTKPKNPSKDQKKIKCSSALQSLTRDKIRTYVILSGCTCVEVADEGVEAVAASLEAIGCDVLTVVEKCLELIRREDTALGVGVAV